MTFANVLLLSESFCWPHEHKQYNAEIYSFWCSGCMEGTHIGSIEEVANGEQCGQDVLQCPVVLQLVHTFLQILERLSHFLQSVEKVIIRAGVPGHSLSKVT